MQEPKLVVIDASVVLKWQLDDEDYVSQAITLRNDFYALSIIKAIAPSLLIYELINGILTASRRERLDSGQAVEAMNNLMELGVELREIKPDRVLELALEQNLAAYDAAYLALAESQGCELWTGDRPFYQAVKDEFSWIRWIGDYVSVASNE